MKPTILPIVALIILTFLSDGCKRQPDSRLVDIEKKASVYPDGAWDSLKNIDVKTLSDADKHYYDFLCIKVADKSFITHESDSAILSVINYESSHKYNGRYPEALYYGGRVYYDLGDYPQALQYFQSALNEVKDDDNELKERILSQTGRLLNSLHLYNEAIPYIEEVLEKEKINKDTLHYVQDMQLLGGIYLCSENYNEAERCFKKAKSLSHSIPKQYIAKSNLYIAVAKYNKGEIDSALSIIRGIPDEVSPIIRDAALANAANIYLAAGICDTAYMYAFEIINNDEYDYNNMAYGVLTSPKLHDYVHRDSLDQYIAEYRTIIEDYYDENSNQLAINQQAFYNYGMHDKERIKAEKKSNEMRGWLMFFIFIVLILGLILLYIRGTYQNKIIKLQNAITGLENKENDDIPVLISSDPRETVNNLREKLRDKLLSIYQDKANNIPVDPAIISSEPYAKLQRCISSEHGIKDSDPVWDELEKVILSVSPSFKENLSLLAVGKLTTNDLHTSILIKCGITPTQMCIILNRTKGAIVSRRESLCKRIFDKKLGTKVIDGVIRLL